MIRPEVAIAVSEVSARFMFDSCKPNTDVVEKVLSFDVNDLDTLDLVDLSKFIIVLGQYLVSMKYNENEITIQKIEVEREYDRKSMLNIRERSWKTNVPLKEKKALVTSESHELSELLFKKEVFESQLAMLDGMYNSMVEYMNAYKREQSRRVGQV